MNCVQFKNGYYKSRYLLVINIISERTNVATVGAKRGRHHHILPSVGGILELDNFSRCCAFSIYTALALKVGQQGAANSKLFLLYFL